MNYQTNIFEKTNEHKPNEKVYITPRNNEVIDEVHYQFLTCQFGILIITANKLGICSLDFIEDKTIAIKEIQTKFSSMGLSQKGLPIFQEVIAFINHPISFRGKIPLHLKGTDFQQKVWQNLLTIPFGTTTTYSVIAQNIGKPEAVRAVGTAIGQNPIALLIPCHRVLALSGKLSGFKWGIDRKKEILLWEKKGF